MTSSQVAYCLKEIRTRTTHESDIKQLELEFYAKIHGAQYTPALSSEFKTNVLEQELAQNSKETDAKIEAHMKKRMAEINAKAATRGT